MENSIANILNSLLSEISFKNLIEASFDKFVLEKILKSKIFTSRYSRNTIAINAKLYNSPFKNDMKLSIALSLGYFRQFSVIFRTTNLIIAMATRGTDDKIINA